jgi:magnesium transporter
VAQNPDSWHSGVAYFLYLTSQFVIDAYYPLLDRVSSQLNTIEEKLLNSGTKNDVRKSVYRIKQQLINLRQMVAPQREVFSSVIGEKRVAEDSDIRDLFRHLYERLLRVYDVIDSQRDLSSNVLDMMENQESRKLAEAVSRLTILSMIFLPLTFFTGLFQLNFATTTDQIILPISGNIMFAVVMAAMIFSVGVMAFVFRRRGWL